MSRTFFDQARYARAVEAYRMLLESEPDDANAPQYLRQIAAAYAAMEDAEHAMAALSELARNYGPNSAWAKKQSDPEIVSKAERAASARSGRHRDRSEGAAATLSVPDGRPHHQHACR